MRYEIDALFAADKTSLRKKFYFAENQELRAESYPHVFQFNSVRTAIHHVDAFAELIQAVGDQGGCLLKGTLDRALRAESRAGHTAPEGDTQWICLDVDGLRGVDTVQDFLRLLPEEFRTTSHVVQYSSSMGIIDKGLSAHVFFLLNKRTPVQRIKRWLIHANLTIPHLMARLALTRSRVALRFPLDVTTCQEDKLIYVAPAERGQGVIDTFEEERVQVVKKRFATLNYEFDVGEAINVEQLMVDEMNRIRENAGLPRQEHDFKRIGKVEVLKDVTADIQITECKTERGFVYINLNGGDSWGYYHPEDNPKVLYNFKGEPNLDVEAVFPQYYYEYADGGGAYSVSDNAVVPDRGTNQKDSQANPAAPSPASTDDGEGEPEWVTRVGIDDTTGGYFGVRYSPDTGFFRYREVAQRIQLKDFCHQYGVPTPERLQRWRVEYDFQDYTYKVDEDNHRINLFNPPVYIQTPDRDKSGRVPPTIETVLRHVVGDDGEAYELLLNWLACVVQYRRAIGTAWLLSGTQGTGKGVFFTHIMMPILGRDYVARATLPTFEKEFNGFMERSLLVFVDEIRLKELKQASVALSNLKQYITDDVIAVRRMRTDSYLIDNHANFVFASNHYDSMEIDPSDRRFLVAPRQEAPLSSAIQVDGIDTRIRGELAEFAKYLCTRTADLQLARRMYHSSERQRLKHLTRNASDEVADALRAGNFEFFVQEAPEHDAPGEAAIQAKLPKPIAYAKFIRMVLESEHHNVNIPRDMLRMVWWHITGAWFQTPTKFSKFIGKMGLEVKKIRIGDDLTRGLHDITFNVSDETRQEALRWLAKQNEHVKSATSTMPTSIGDAEK